MKKSIRILAIETSCDETAAAIVENGRNVLSNVIATQMDLHAEYGGVVPEIASRKHVELILPVIDNAFNQAKITLNEIDAIAVTYGPGLVGALLVGLTAAKSIAFAANKPLVGVHHIEGHIAANYIQFKELEPPFICLVASGGHSHIVLVREYDQFDIIGRTRDDAAGEAFDKIARAVGLGYPGGPKIDKEAKKGNPQAINFPRVKFKDNIYDFSFSGVKTSVLNYLNICRLKEQEINVPDICASFQQAVVDVLVDHTLLAAKEYNVNTVCIAGGVAANTLLRNEMKRKAGEINVFYPEIALCTDNAAMIGSAGYYEFIKGKRSSCDLNANPGLKLGLK